MIRTALDAVTHLRPTLILTVGLSLSALWCAERPADVAEGDNALAALAAGAASSRYQTAYWLEQSRTNPTEWAQAESYCGGRYAGRDGKRPNCTAVIQAREALDWQARGPVRLQRR